MNILDVWFDSGSSHEAVLSVRPELSWPADLYLEGSDQHRGWFQSSLLVGLGTRGRPPFRQVVTHGFVVADDGRKMSKSLGNSIEPEEIIKTSGADILRLWVAMGDFTQEIRLSKEILARAVEAYRKIRNTLRYLLGNLYDFDPAIDRMPLDRLEEIDRYILGRYGELGQRITKAYADYDYATVFQGLNAFTTVDLSAFYADVSKDRLYTFAARSPQRRSAQTAMYVMAEGLTRLMAPILPFTADEVWHFVPGAREESVHLALFPADAELAALADQELLDRWTKLLAVREAVLAEIEPLQEEQADRQLAAGEGRAVRHAGRARAARTLRTRPSHAVHRVRGRAAPGAGRRRGRRRSKAEPSRASRSAARQASSASAAGAT